MYTYTSYHLHIEKSMMMLVITMTMMMLIMIMLTGYRKRAWVVKDAIGLPIASFMCVVVYIIRDWRYLQLTVAIMGALSLITWFFIDESGIKANQ